jgi:hypothetical protein
MTTSESGAFGLVRPDLKRGWLVAIAIVLIATIGLVVMRTVVRPRGLAMRFYTVDRSFSAPVKCRLVDYHLLPKASC